MFRIPKTVMENDSVVSVRPVEPILKCSYTLFECMQSPVEGYSYCIQHILEDVNAPYKQCSFIYNVNNKRCPNAAPKFDRRDTLYCPEHTRWTQIARIKSTSKHTVPQSPELLLLKFNHYVHNPNGNVEDVTKSDNKIKNLDPFTEINASTINAKECDILEYASSSESDVEPTSINDTLRGTFLDDSDTESLNSPQDDPLKHAGVFTAEEVIYITREKLIRLQSLYIDQYRRLQYTLKEKRRKYLHALKKEKESCCSIHDQPKTTPKEKKIYEKLKALNHYHRRSGTEAILYRKSLERRLQATEGLSHKPPNVSKCIFTEGGVKCGERTLPSAKYCRKHILKDQNQVLFKACGAICADIECHEPVPVIFGTNCVFHMNLPIQSKLEAMKFEDHKDEPQDTLYLENHAMEIDVVGESQEIDPDDDMAGLMREMSDATGLKPVFNESLNSEASTDTAFSISAQMSDKDELVSI